MVRKVLSLTLFVFVWVRKSGHLTAFVMSPFWNHYKCIGCDSTQYQHQKHVESSSANTVNLETILNNTYQGECGK